MKNILSIMSVLALVLTGFTSPSFADTLNVAEDSYIELGNQNNFGKNQSISVQNTNLGPNKGETWGVFHFDLSALPENTKLGEATLRLWVDKVAQPGAIQLYTVTSEWNESDITSSNIPSLGDLLGDISIDFVDEGHFVAVDLTELVNDWLDTTVPNFGIALVPDSTGVNILLDSKENRQTSHPAEIEAVPEAVTEAETGLAVKSIQGGSIQVLCKAQSSNYIKIGSQLCPAGWVVLGGGYFINRLPEPVLDVYMSRPITTTGGSSGWKVGVVNLDQCPWSTFNVYVNCTKGTVEFVN